GIILYTSRNQANLSPCIQDVSVDDLIEMDKNYLQRITLRRRIMKEHPETVLAAEKCVKSSTDDFYVWLVGAYLPTRSPRMFTLTQEEKEKPSSIHNLVTNETFSLCPADNPLDTLRILSGLVEDDLLFLLPSDDGGGYMLKGFVSCFPNGFNTATKFNLELRDIHTPIPQYREKLEKSMDRYFEKLKAGKFIQRANWTITTTDHLFTVSGTHLPMRPLSHLRYNFITLLSLARVRCERQSLHRLPQSRAILFSFKTYLYSLPEIKDEGFGEILAQAIDGLKEGNAPAFLFYKRAVVSGGSAKAYLRS
ncbi:hypothetical protein NUU61_008707, partial [Penicillium alfredii]